ncbi:hypothetical protein DF3PB_1090003 [uncultured Defluviicoccus sp.]|uniref:Cytochrome c domain-containing protein n=1 Tax=metagenome TaxID=256318 RepID=A0A380TA49_9ZZZZ|nr:hypothetical protein DF3PB_1090003 [uncultured Defluviicoccus sp.]
MSADEDAPTYENLCAACHGADGRGRTPQGRKMKAGDLRESRLTDEQIARQIRHGSPAKTGSSAMPAVGRDLTDTEVEALVRVVKAFRPPAPPPK